MRNYLKLGDWNAICDVCGFKFKASMLRRRWDGAMVCQTDYELRHPQDFLRVRPEVIAPPWARPEATDTFVSGNEILAEDNFNLLTENSEILYTEA